MSRNTLWTNQDGLRVGFGTHSEDNDVQAVTQGANGLVTVRCEYVLADLPDTFAATNVKPQDHVIPRGSIIKSAIIHTLVTPDSAGDNLTVDIGTWGVGLATEVVDSADGIVADATQAEIGTVGQGSICDGALIVDAVAASAGVGATSNSDVVLAVSYESAAATVGTIALVVEYMPPMGSFGRTIAN